MSLVEDTSLSRLETGQRRPTLELFLVLSRAYRVPLGDGYERPSA